MVTFEVKKPGTCTSTVMLDSVDDTKEVWMAVGLSLVMLVHCCPKVERVNKTKSSVRDFAFMI